MSERPRPAGSADLLHHLGDTGAPVAVTSTGLGVAATVTGPCGTALLTVTLQAASPEAPPEEGDAQALLVVAAGVVDIYTTPLLEAALNDAVDRHSTVRCDLSGVRLLSADGISTLVRAYRRAAESGSRLTVRGARGHTRRVLEITKVEHLLSEP